MEGIVGHKPKQIGKTDLAKGPTPSRPPIINIKMDFIALSTSQSPVLTENYPSVVWFIPKIQNIFPQTWHRIPRDSSRNISQSFFLLPKLPLLFANNVHFFNFKLPKPQPLRRFRLYNITPSNEVHFLVAIITLPGKIPYVAIAMLLCCSWNSNKDNYPRVHR